MGGAATTFFSPSFPANASFLPPSPFLFSPKNSPSQREVAKSGSPFSGQVLSSHVPRKAGSTPIHFPPLAVRAPDPTSQGSPPPSSPGYTLPFFFTRHRPPPMCNFFPSFSFFPRGEGFLFSRMTFSLWRIYLFSPPPPLPPFPGWEEDTQVGPFFPDFRTEFFFNGARSALVPRSFASFVLAS